MNIWFLTTEYPPDGGGIGTYIGHAAAMFAGAGHAVTILKPGPSPQVIETPGIRRIEFAPRQQFLTAAAPVEEPPDRHPAFPYNLMDYWPALSYQFVDELKEAIADFGPPDIIETQDYGAIGYYPLVRRLLEEPPLAHLPLVVHLHAPVFEIERVIRAPRYKLPRYWLGQMEKFCLRAADGLLSPSAFLARRVEQQLQGLPPITVIPYPLRPPDAAPAPPTPADVVYFGRMDTLKGAPQLVAACARLWQAGQNFTLTLIGGDGYVEPGHHPTKAYLRRKYAHFLDAGQLLIADPLPAAQLHQRIARAWCVVIPSLFENFPNACLEAMWLGRLVLASTSGGQAEVVGPPEPAGLLFDWAKPGDLEAKLNQALALSPAENEAIGRRARQRIAAMTAFEQVLPQRLAFFEQVIEHSRTPRRFYPAARAGLIPQPDPAEQPGLLSVIIPHYNLGAYLPDAVNSSLVSTYAPLEVIVIDDGSDDPASLAVLDSLASWPDERLRLIRVENGGVARARNLAAQQARGEFLALVDADDTVQPDFFSRAVRVLQRYPNVSIVYSWVRFFGARSGGWITFNAEFPFMLGQNMVAAMSVVRREHFLKYGQQRPQIEALFEDYDGWLGMLAAGCLGVSLPDMLVNYRVRPDSRSRHGQDTFDTLLYTYDLLTHDRPWLYQEHAVDLINLLLANGPSFLWSHPAYNWVSPPEQLEALSQRYQTELNSQDFVTRHFIRLTWRNLGRAIKNPARAWQKFLKWRQIYFKPKPSTRLKG